MTDKLAYNGIPITEIHTADKTIVFDPPQSMLVWNDSPSPSPSMRIRTVISITPRFVDAGNVVTAIMPDSDFCPSALSIWDHCAELPGSKPSMRRCDIQVYHCPQLYETSSLLTLQKLPSQSLLWPTVSKHSDQDCGQSESQLMTKGQLQEWLARGNGVLVTSPNELCTELRIGQAADGDSPVSSYWSIRHFQDFQWTSPWKSIYDQDCGSDRARHIPGHV